MVEFHNCTFVFKKKFVNARWFDVKIFNCKFTGVLCGNDMGNMESVANEGYFSALHSADFSNCILDGVRFVNVDLTKIILPHWPCFTILNEVAHKQELISIKSWKEYSLRYIDIEKYTLPNTTALTYYFPSLMNDFNVDEDDFLDEIKVKFILR
jgi:hypothetical protein